MSSAECPTCGKELSTKRGMRQHHTKVHDEPLPNRTCSGCDEEFYDPKARREFCDSCNPNAGKHNGNWKGAKETATCERCGDKFEFYPSNKEGRYCPDCVEEADEFLGKPYAEVVDVERIHRECDHCGKSMEVLASERKYGAGRFCSRDCLSNWMSENRRGKNHHNWDNGGGKYVGKWSRARKKALERDDYQCQNCGTTTEEIGRNPDVHHIVPLRKFDEPQDAHALDNLVSLCRKCHRNVETGNIQISAPNPDRIQG